MYKLFVLRSIIVLTLVYIIYCMCNKDYQSKYNNIIIDKYTEASTKKYKLCLMAIFKGEQDYLEEWLLHHINQGISHFYLYSNDEKMYNYPYFTKYSNYITMIPWINKKNNGSSTIQRQAYGHCVKSFSNEFQYIMMLDIDEFIVSTLKSKQKPHVRVIDIINTLDNNSTKAIKVRRYNFGSNGHLLKPKGNIMDQYTKHEKICSSYKTIANSEYLNINKPFYGVHDFPFTNKKGKIYNDYFTYKKTGYPNRCTENDTNEIPLVINHYYTKSYEEYLRRCDMWKKGGVNNVGYREDCTNKFKVSDVNEIHGYDYL
jgi:hypothetical protein